MRTTIARCRWGRGSRVLAHGESLQTIARLPGHHTRMETPARYAHLANDSVRKAAARVSESMEAVLLSGCPG